MLPPANEPDFPYRDTRCLPAGPEAVRAAVTILRAGGLVAFPTETVYGLGADAGSDRAVASIYAAKGRPSFNPLIAHLADRDAAFAHGMFGEQARALAERFWPGAMTLVVPVSAGCGVSLLARAGLDTVALRVPAHPLAREMLEAFGGPVVAPSANRSGRVSPTTAEHVLADLEGRCDLVIDGGPTQVGVESTIVACIGTEVRILRPGGVPAEALEEVLGRRLGPASANAGEVDGKVRAPGMLASHYAPRAWLRLNARRAEPGEAVLDFNRQLSRTAPQGAVRCDLSATGDLVEAAANLFAALHELDSSGADRIAVAPVPEAGLGVAINDRLRRAAAPRP